MRNILLVFGLIAIVFLVMPTAMAKFTGQHEFINGSSVNCTTCHSAIAAELSSGEVHQSLSCRDCHIPNTANATLPYYNQGSLGTSTYHAAALIECTYCHGIINGTSTAWTGTPIPVTNVTQEFVNSQIEAHRPLYYRAENASGIDTTNFLKGANEACIACHTHAANVTIIEPTQYLNITANATDCTGWLPHTTVSGVTADCYNDGNGFNWSIKIDINRQ